MRYSQLSKRRYLEVAQVFHWATRAHYAAVFTGSFGRHKRTEVVLPRLVAEGKLIVCKHRKPWAYCVPRKGHAHGEKCHPLIEHGLACTECLVRCWLSRRDGEVVAEKHFKGMGIVPEWGICYPNRKLLLFEFCTRDNFEYAGNVRGKITRYQDLLQSFEAEFPAKPLVLFVFDVSRDRVVSFVQRVLPVGPFFFTDYATFLSAPLAKTLQASIYIWGEDGQEYPIIHD